MPNYENLKLFRILTDEIKQVDESSKSQHKAYLVPFRMLSVSGFKFPFSNPAKIREAIKLQTITYSGGTPIQISPVIVNKSPKDTSGFCFFLPDSELAELEKITEDASSPIFPAPFALCSSVDGNGITVWLDEKNICSVIWRSGVPELYRWHAKNESALDSEISWLKKFCESKEIEVNSDVFIFDAEDDVANLLPILKKSLTSFPWLKEVNLSRGAINSVLILERFVRFTSRAAIWLTVFGLVFVAGSWLNYSTINDALANTRSSSEKLYRDVFDSTGRIDDPVRQAGEKIRVLRVLETSGKTFGDVLSDLGFPHNINSIDVTIDNLSYGNDGATVDGSGKSEIIRSFRASLAETVTSIPGATVILGTVQQIPGSENYRFNIVISWK